MSHVRPLPRTPHHLTHPADALALATERLHDAFRSVPFRPDMPRVRGTVTSEDLAALERPVAELDPALVGRFVLRVGTTWGGSADLRRVLPRALELAADHRLPIARSLLWSKMVGSGLHTWSGAERRAVREFLRAEWRRLLCAPPRAGHRAHRWLADIPPSTLDPSPFLDIWQEELRDRAFDPHHRAVTGHLVRLLIDSPIRPDLPRTIADVLPGDEAGTRALRGFLLADRTMRRLEEAVRRHSGTRDDRRFRIATERLRRLRSRSSSEPPAELIAGS